MSTPARIAGLEAGSDRTHAQPDARPVRLWLYTMCVLVFAMIVVGGATRLTGSGLSITEWQPIMGVIPPLTEGQWQEAFDLYREIPQYRLVNRGMSLDAFRTIYWWEWSHRFLGRFLGVAFLVPFLFFWLTGRIGRALMPRLLGILALGAAQGILGWYMVMSGLVDRVEVSQYRLAAHLGLAFIILGALLWVALELRPRAWPGAPVGRGLALSATGLVGLLFLQIVLGAFVAGLNAGMGYNTWPSMDGQIVPDGLWAMTPWYLNPFENALAVQFNHRLIAYVVAVWAVAHAVLAIRRTGEGSLAVSAALVLLAVLAQTALGIWTLVAQVPIGLGLAHQAGAAVLFMVAIHHLYVVGDASAASGRG